MAAGAVFKFIPLGQTEEILLTYEDVRKVIAVKTKSGKEPSDQDIRLFLELCRAKRLNPFVGDAFLIGYDTQDGPQFSQITAHQAILKRAEISPQYDGMESGVTVIRKLPVRVGSKKPTEEELEERRREAETPIAELLVERPGELLLNDEIIVGAWCRVYRKDRSRPEFAAITFSVYNTGKSRWAKDPAGMAVKVAEAAALRAAFPTDLSGMYNQNEFDHVIEAKAEPREPAKLVHVEPIVIPSAKQPEREKEPVARQSKGMAGQAAEESAQRSSVEREPEADEPPPRQAEGWPAPMQDLMTKIENAASIGHARHFAAKWNEIAGESVYTDDAREVMAGVISRKMDEFQAK